MEPFSISLGGLGAQVGTMLNSLSPIFLAVVATVIAAGALGWAKRMFLGVMADSDSRVGGLLRGATGIRAHWVRDYLDGNSDTWY
jgi:hypothetical protein